MDKDCSYGNTKVKRVYLFNVEILERSEFVFLTTLQKFM